jgi:hypothetical protein
MMIKMRFVAFIVCFFFRVSTSAESTVKGVLELLAATVKVDDSFAVSYRCNFQMESNEGYRIMNLEGDDVDVLCKNGLELEMTVGFLPYCERCVALQDIHSIGGTNVKDMALQGQPAIQLRGVAESDSNRVKRLRWLLQEGLNYLTHNNRLLSTQTVSVIPGGPRKVLQVMMILVSH